LHRQLKSGALGYEDEKFSYLIASKLAYSPSGKRVLRTPIKRKGHHILELCTPIGIEKKIISKKEKDLYRKVKWGDLIGE